MTTNPWRGRCYEAAFMKALDLGDGAYVVHGTPAWGDGRRYGHAWAEKNGRVFDLTEGEGSMPVPIYYAIRRLSDEDVDRYPLEDAVLVGAKVRHFGPWRQYGPDIVFAERFDG